MAEGLRSRKRNCSEVVIGGKEAATSNQVRWSSLSHIPLERIFSMLNRKDQFTMARVCLRWSEGLQFLCVWKKFDFIMRNRLSHQSLDEIYFVKKYGKLFRYLTIQCEVTEGMGLMRCWLRRLKTFMRILSSKTQLIEIDFIDVSFRLIPDSNPTYKMICEAIADFLGSQTQLKSLSFSYSEFKYSDAVRILSRAIQNNRGIATLNLPGFLEYVKRDPQDSAEEQILPEILSLPNLKSVECDYGLILGERANPSQVFESFKNCQKMLSLRLLFNINEDSKRFSRLTSYQWITLRSANPNLKVGLNIFSTQNFQAEVEYFMVEGTPVTLIEYAFESNSESGYSITNLLNFLVIRNINEYLRFLDLKFYEEIGDLDTIFKWFLRTCKKLESFILLVRYPVHNIDMLLDSLLERKPGSLNEIVLFIENLPNSAKQSLTDLSSAYQPRLRSVQIALQINFL